MKEHPFDAVIFDLDGVITQTALLHSQAWKKMFDDYLREREKRYHETFMEFRHEQDYLPYVDGKPRYDGVRSFLESRNISIPFGHAEDTPDTESICGIGNRKNLVFNNILEKEGVRVYPSTVELIHTLKEKGIRVGVASSSKNCAQVLDAAGLTELIETRIDGVVSNELGLNGKPEPDIFTTAADRLGVSYDRTVVVEDAVSGVAAGKKGNFGLVLGLARENNKNELLSGGADIVVKDIAEIGYEGIKNWFEDGMLKDSWQVVYHGFDPGREKTWESLLTIGNGYFGTRGALEECSAGEYHYPGTYMAGLYNRRTSKVAGRDVENEDLVNITNWLPIDFRIEGGHWLKDEQYKLLSMERILHMDNGLLSRKMTIRDEKGRETLIESERLASMDDPHLAAIKFSITPLNYGGIVEIKAGLSGQHINDGVARYRTLEQKHIEPVREKAENDMQSLVVQTTGAGINIAVAARLKVVHAGKEIISNFRHEIAPGTAESIVNAEIRTNERLTLEKTVAIYKSDDIGADDIESDAIYKVYHCGNFDSLLSDSAAVWREIWQKADIYLEGDRLAQKLLRLHIYHLIVSISPHNATIDAGIPARGLHGEAYRGHIFWDEIYILPFYYMHFPEVARAVLDYRYKRLEAAKKNATQFNENGALFPWQSGSEGREETQVIHLNPVSGEWGPDHSSLQRHVSLAIAYNIIQYFHYTNDKSYHSRGLEMLIEICRFWAGKAEADSNGRFSVAGVMGPDEFHEKYPESEKGGLKDNAYTNIMLVWVLRQTLQLMKQMDPKEKSVLFEKVELGDNEIMDWAEISQKLKLDISN
ncbi:MAG TPA: beta-phosphoglucomutase family hydrolase, partial [Bacteroidales bacterium]|nr:beta-phosphoglucomutase family hydrolase [Bacteroidales bacterium]